MSTRFSSSERSSASAPKACTTPGAHAEIHLLILGAHGVAGDDLARERRQVYRGESLQRHRSVEAREIHELLHQPPGTLDAARKLVQRR